jgi:plasmid maintenance system antidote protein VapI
MTAVRFRWVVAGGSAQLWMNLQNRYDLEIARREIGKKLDKIERIIAHVAA